MIELAFLRNCLSNGIWRPEDQDQLKVVRAEVAASTSPYRAIALNAIDNAFQDVAERRYGPACVELDFIHNLDFEHGFPDAWHEMYFLGAFVSDYLIQVKDLDRARRVLMLLGEAVAAQERDPDYQLRQKRDRSFRSAHQVENIDKLIWVGGRPGVGLEAREKYAMKTYGGELLWEVAVEWEPAGYHEPAWVGWPEAGVILLGGGQEIYAFDLDSGTVRHHQVLDRYFMGFAFTPDRTRLIVIDGSSVAALDATLRELWRTPVAVDGIIIQELNNDLIRVDAELDPPGGWKPFVLDTRTGHILDQPT